MRIAELLQQASDSNARIERLEHQLIASDHAGRSWVSEEHFTATVAAKDARLAELERRLEVTEHTSDVAHSSVFEMDARITTLETALRNAVHKLRDEGEAMAYKGLSHWGVIQVADGLDAALGAGATQEPPRERRGQPMPYPWEPDDFGAAQEREEEGT